MDWLSDLLKVAIGYLSTPEGKVILIVVILTGIVTVILGYAIPAFGRFLRRLPKSIGRFSQMLKKRYQNWCYLRKYGTACGIYEKGKLQIEKAPQDHGYNITLEFSLKFTNRDNLNELMINCEEINIHINSESVDGQKTRYLLTYVHGTVWSIHWIKPTKSETIPYKVRCWSKIKPWLGSTARCYIKVLGDCRLNPASKNLMRKPFSVDVDWFNVGIRVQ